MSAQADLQAKRKSVMPAKAGIQCGGVGGEVTKPGFPLQPEADPSFGGFAGKTEGEVDFQSTL